MVITKTAAVLLAGERLPSGLPCALAEVLFEPVLHWALADLTDRGIDDVILVAGDCAAEIAAYLAKTGREIPVTDRLPSLPEDALVIPCATWPGRPEYLIRDGRSLWRCNEWVRRVILQRHMEAGVGIPCTDGVIVGREVQIGSDTLLLPGTILRGKTVLGRGCTVGPQTMLTDTVVGDHCTLYAVQGEGANVGDGTQLGPYVRLRPGAQLGRDIRVGNFVEIKNSTVGDRTKIAHLSYVGDAHFGRDVNVGCGLAVANYDGQQKHRTTVGDGAFLGCHNSLVAPIHIGPGAYTAAGSTLTQDVPAGALAFGRARQVNKARDPDV
ncbi:MAG: hypothetical protein LBJ11_11085 [Oscillospiraceae bacterium]|jgi:bifunctional N-acetylglucosamine-1-phosphate-uridyltransferase/glucosamine-1-phosphate-acetyltransferase GlmU-like protein|nr:hypothetical protein [Oscillospiraceae bacterium]